MSDIIPDYSKYSIPELVDVYQRIQKEKYPEKVNELRKQICSKLNLENSIDLNSLEIQELFERIDKEGYPFKASKIKNEALGKTINKLGWIFIGLAFLFLILDRLNNNSVLTLWGISFFILFMVSNVIQSYFTGEINIQIFAIKESENPTLFTIFQAIFFFIALIGLFGIIRWIVS
jgi:hypothetical protein